MTIVLKHILIKEQFYKDYGVWQREFLDYPNTIDYRDIAQNQKEFVFYCSDFNLQNLIDIKPNSGSSYIRSLTEPFDLEMELKEEQIKNWFDFFPKKQIHVLSTEEMRNDPKKTLLKIFEFLEISEYNIKNPQKQKSANYDFMKQETRQKLLNFYREHNEKFFATIGKRFDWEI